VPFRVRQERHGGRYKEKVDLYLIHWPQGGPTWAWPGIERARELGFARSIGVSNFSVSELGELIVA
jgi:diketogulonate reductase-like aldo/keto reductase